MVSSVSSENMCESEGAWTPADFRDIAHELKRRLAVWHIKDRLGPVWIPDFLEWQKAIRYRFRDVCLTGEHGPKPKPSIQLFPGSVSNEASKQGFVGTAFRNLPTYGDKQLTLWLLRDFFEHLRDAGEGEQGKYLRRVVDRILDAPVYCRREANEVERQWLRERNQDNPERAPHAFIGGRPVDESLLDQLMLAVESLWTWWDSTAASNVKAGGAFLRAMESRAAPAETPSEKSSPKKGKRSTERGEGQAKLIAGLTKHHEYADGSCLNLEPVGNNELARLAKVSESTASAFFKKRFGGRTKYRAICSDASRLIAAIKLLNQEFSPHHLLGAKPASDREDEE